MVEGFLIMCHILFDYMKDAQLWNVFPTEGGVLKNDLSSSGLTQKSNGFPLVMIWSI